MSVRIPENLLFELVELLREPKSLKPGRKECVIDIEKRNRLLARLMAIQRDAVGSPSNAVPLELDSPSATPRVW